MTKQKQQQKKTEAPKAPGTRTETPPRMLTLSPGATARLKPWSG